MEAAKLARYHGDASILVDSETFYQMMGKDYEPKYFHVHGVVAHLHEDEK